MNYAGKFGSGGLGPDSGVDIDLGLLSQRGQLSSSGNFHVDKVSTHAPSDAIIVSDAHLLFHGDFKRSGVDLVLTSGDRELVLPDYFRGEKRAALASPDGAHLTGDIVKALAGHTQFAQADGSASVAPQLIGHVTKLTGNATAIRNGVSIVLNQGDTVHKGDVVQSGSDSTLGITFIDGTVFGLASNAKMVLNEMIYDPNGSDNKSLLSLVQGTISFVAGATAKKGDMKVDTPVATMGIRGTAVLVEIDFEVPGQGGAPPAKFQVLVEPDGTTGSYILFDKTTLTQIATVNRAGTQTIINGQGAVSFQSSVQLSPDAQKIISDVFSLKFTDLNNPNTKLTTNFTNSIVPETLFVKLASSEFVPVTLQFLNTPDKPAAGPSTGPGPTLIHIAGPPIVAASDGSLTERTATTGSAAVDSISGIVSYADINPDDVPSVQAAFSSFIYANAQKVDVTATLTAEQLAAIKAVEVPLSVVQDPNGKNTGQATWTYNIADGAFDFLAVGETLTLTYMARVDNNYAPSNETTFVPFTIVITGTNDKPTLSATGGTITERIGTGNAAVDTVTGSVTFADVDLTDRPVVSAAISTTDPFRYYDAEGNDVTATLTPAQLAAIKAVEVPLSVVQAAGNTHNGSASWTYSIEDSKFDFIAKGETLTLNYVAQVDDGHGGIVSTPITVSIRGADVVVVGTNDVPIIVEDSTTATNSVTEDEAATLVAGGTIAFQDLDLTDTHTATFVLKSSNANANLPGYSEAAPLSQIGAFSLTAVSENPGVTTVGSIGWSFALNNNDPVLQSLAVGQAITQVYTVTFDDHHGGTVTQDVTVTITGTNDAPTITSNAEAASGAVVEDASSPTLSTGGAIAIQDLDLIDTHTATWEFKLSASNEHLPGFDEGDTHIGTFTIDPSVTESTGDIYNGATLGWSFTLNNNDAVLQSLALGQTITQVYTVTFADHHGGTVTQDVTVTITGTNDAPTIVAGSTTASGGVTEDTVVASGEIETSGTIAIQDLDLIDTHTATWEFKLSASNEHLPGFDEGDPHIGTFTIDPSVTESTSDIHNGATLGWSFTLNNNDAVLQSLALGQTITQVYTVTFADHHGGTVTQDVTVTITGANDAPVAIADTDTGHIVEAGHDIYDNVVAGVSTTTGDVLANDTDVDLSDTHEVVGVVAGTASSVLSTGVGTTIVGTYGSLVLNADGTWTYTLDNDNSLTNALAQGAHASDVFSYTESDHNGGTSTTTLTIDITGTNDAPVTNTAPLAVTDVDAGAPVVEQGVNGGVDTATGNVLSNDADVDTGDTKSVQGVASGTATGPLTEQVATSVAGTYGHVTIGADGTWTYTLDNDSAVTQALTQDQHVSEVFTYTMRDALGSTASATLTIDITGANDAPVITSDGGGATAAISVAESSTAVTTVQAGDVDGPSMTYSIIGGANSPDAAKFAINSVTGALSFVTAPNFESPASAVGSNVYTVQVKAADGAGGFDVQTIAVTVADVEEAPIATDDSVAGASEDSTLAIASSTLLANDGDGDDLTVSSFDQTSAKGAALTLSGTDITYDPTQVTALQALAAGEATTDTFTYAVSDGHGRTDTATVTLTVAGVNDAPVVQGETSTKEAHLANANGVAVFNGQFFFGNNKLTVSDPDHNAQFGIAVIGVDNGGAVDGWEYLTSGADWIKIKLDPGEALLLSATDKVRFSGSGNGNTEQLTFVAWDGTDGLTSGSIIAIPQQTGGTTAFSSGVYGVGAKNDAPVINATQFTVADQAGTGSVTLTGTQGKDVIFATGHDDMLIGGGGPDQFIFTPEDSPNTDTIMDFAPGRDHIDLRAFAAVDSSTVSSWLANPLNQINSTDVRFTLDTNDTVILKNVVLANLHVSDFIVSPH